MPEILENADANLTPRMRNLVSLLWGEWKNLEQQIVAMNEEVEQIASSDPACQRLRQIPGIGPLVATAIVAAIGNGAAAFHKGREFSSWLGLVPRQHSTGGRARLFGISKRGNCYLRSRLSASSVVVAENPVFTAPHCCQRLLVLDQFRVATIRPNSKGRIVKRASTRIEIRSVIHTDVPRTIAGSQKVSFLCRI
jgi:hypothetical protein